MWHQRVIQMLPALVGQALCMSFNVGYLEGNGNSVARSKDVRVQNKVGGRRSLAVDDDRTGIKLAKVSDDDYDDVDFEGVVGQPVCTYLYGNDSAVPYKFTAVTRYQPFVCQETSVLFDFPSASMFDHECAQRCLATPTCSFVMIDNDDKTCTGFEACTVTDAQDNDKNVSIYKRRAGSDATRRKGAFLESFSTKARQRMLLYFDFGAPLPADDARRLPATPTQGQRQETSISDQTPPADNSGTTRRRVSRRRQIFKDTSGGAYGQLWNSGTGDDRKPPEFFPDGKYGGYWSFKGTKTGIRVAQTEELMDYSYGPGATMVLAYRKEGYDSNMGRIFSGPNVDLYGWTRGMAMNMNDIRCLYPDPGLYDNGFHVIFVILTFATGNVELWRNDVFLGNGTHGPPFAEFEHLKRAFPWLVGIRYEYDAERPYEGGADEFAIFSWRFNESDRQRFIAKGGSDFNNCADKDQSLQVTFGSELQYANFTRECNQTCRTCVQRAVTRAVANKSAVEQEYISTILMEGPPHEPVLVQEVNISVAPCTLEGVRARILPLRELLAEIRAELNRSKCGVDIPIPDPPAYCEVPNPPPNCYQPGPVPNPNRTYFMDPYIHPRVLFTPQDLPTIRTRLTDSWVAQEARNTMQDMVELNNTGSAYGQMYQKLLLCDTTEMDAFKTVQELLVNPRNNTEWIAYPDIYTMFMYRGLMALLDEDNATAAQLGAALACHSTFMSLVYVPEDNNILNEDCEPALGLAYDYLFNYMTENQRTIVRQLISTYTTGRVPFGSGMAGWHLGANGVGFYDGVVIQSLAIEGEEGYDVLVFENDVRKQRDFYNWGVFESGLTHEGWHYFMFAMEGAGPALLAAEIRGRGVLGNTSAKEALTGAFYQLSPWVTGEQVKVFSFSDGAGIGSPGRINVFYPIMKRLYPSDPVVDFMYNMQIEHQEDRKLTSDWLLFGSLPSSTNRTSQDVADLAKLSLSRFCPDSGRVIMRSDWTQDGMSVHFSSRMDTYGLQKMHADINTLALFSHRRQWVSDTDLAGTLKLNAEFNDYHSTILIDGLGQSGSSDLKTWPSLPGRIIDFSDKGVMAYAVGDATLAYSYYGVDYNCSKKKRENCTADTGCTWDANVWACVKDWAVDLRAPRNLTTDYRWGEANEEANMKTFSYPKFFNGSDRNLDADSEKWRSELTVCPLPLKGRCWGGNYNPVRFAFRTVMMVRGRESNPHPYVLVIDDIQAEDAQEHNYTISWQVRPHQDHWSRRSADRDIKRWENNRRHRLKRTGPSEAVLTEDIITEQATDDGPELVVRLVGDPVGGSVNDTFILLEEAGRSGQSGLLSSGHQRLQATRTTTLPMFKTILYPREASDPQLETSYNVTADTLTVKIGDTVDVFKFSTDDSGRHKVDEFLRNDVLQ